MSLKPSKLFNVAAIVPILLGLCSALFMAYVFYWPPYAAYTTYKPSTHRVEYRNGFIYVHRQYCINDRVPIVINRELVKVGAPGEPEWRFTLPQTVQIYEPGCHEIDRIFEVPDVVPPGNYRLVFYATWQANTFRTEATALPEITVLIPPRNN